MREPRARTRKRCCAPWARCSIKAAKETFYRFCEQDHQFVIRLLMSTRAGMRHVLVEFTSEEIDTMVKDAHQGRT
jgi:hypothetical protein